MYDSNSQSENCRVCWQNTNNDEMGQTMHVFNTIDDIPIVDAIEDISNIKYIKYDTFTKKVCIQCAENVIMAYKTKRQCQKSDSKLRAIALQNSLSQIVKENEEKISFIDESVLVEKLEEQPKQILEDHLIEEPEYLDENDHQSLQQSREKTDNTYYECDIVEEDRISEPSDIENQNADYENSENSHVHNFISSKTTAKVIVKIEPSSVLHQTMPVLENVHYCCQCTKTYPTEVQVIEHFVNFHPACNDEVKPATTTHDSVQCPLCQQTVICMSQHRIRKHYIQKRPKKEEFACKRENCGRVYKSRVVAKNCELRHESERIQCPNCPLTFSKKGNLTTHMKLHLGMAPHLTCDTCGKSFRTRSNLKSHMATHSEAKNYECKICGKTMKRREALINHVKQHSGTKRFACDRCPRAFFYRTDYKRHQMWHNNEKPFKCEVCSKEYIKQSNLKIHEKSHIV